MRTPVERTAVMREWLRESKRGETLRRQHTDRLGGDLGGFLFKPVGLFYTYTLDNYKIGQILLLQFSP